jgi:hypothetical protein
VSGRAQARRTAARSLEGRCPRCGAQRAPTQLYCLECGLLLPRLDGRLALLRRSWVTRLGWYPGDFVWLALAAAVVAAAGGAASIAVARSRDAGRQATIIAPTPPTAAFVPRSEPDGKTRWPPGEAGWTVVLASAPAPAGGRGAEALAARAAAAGLPQVGVLASSRYPSLVPGYDVVFSGIYGTQGDAQTALRSVQARGYPGADATQVTP